MHPAIPQKPDSSSVSVSDGASESTDFRVVFEQYYPRLRSYFKSAGFSTEEAEDLSQAALWSVYRNWEQYRGDGSLAGWIYSVARNAARDEWRRQKRTPPHDSLDRPRSDDETEPAPIDIADDRPNAEAEATHRETMERTITALGKLPLRMRACLLLHVQKGLPYAEVARELALSVPTVKVQIWNARRRLRQLLEGTTLQEPSE
jgi:RNA polymerase sigma factor (sigma-70 family)